MRTYKYIKFESYDSKVGRRSGIRDYKITFKKKGDFDNFFSVICLCLYPLVSTCTVHKLSAQNHLQYISSV